MVDSPLKVKVLSLSGEHMEVACSMDSTVSELKAEITRRTGHLKDLQYLMHEDVALDDKTIIKELGQEEVILTLLVKGLNVEAYIERLRDKGTIERGDLDDLKILCATMRDAFLKQAPLLELEPPLVIGGNLMGSSEQLQHIFDTCGHPPESRYLFLGNYVSRGKNSIDTLTLLLLYKRKFPDQIHLLRGKHECGSISRIYGFYDECKRKLDIRTWKAFIGVFDCMPYAALIQKRILCVPSGLSPELKSIGQLQMIDRPCDVPDTGLLCDLLWSYFETSYKGWIEPDKAVALGYGPDVLEKFLATTQLERIICSQCVVQDGHEDFHEDKLICVFSASHYCGEFENKGAVLLMDEKLEHHFVSHSLPW